MTRTEGTVHTASDMTNGEDAIVMQLEGKHFWLTSFAFMRVIRGCAQMMKNPNSRTIYVKDSLANARGAGAPGEGGAGAGNGMRVQPPPRPSLSHKSMSPSSMMKQGLTQTLSQKSFNPSMLTPGLQKRSMDMPGAPASAWTQVSGTAASRAWCMLLPVFKTNMRGYMQQMLQGLTD